MNTLNELIELVQDAAWLEGRPISAREARRIVMDAHFAPMEVEHA